MKSLPFERYWEVWGEGWWQGQAGGYAPIHALGLIGSTTHPTTMRGSAAPPRTS